MLTVEEDSDIEKEWVEFPVACLLLVVPCPSSPRVEVDTGLLHFMYLISKYMTLNTKF